jgi:hypothetical protein
MKYFNGTCYSPCPGELSANSRRSLRSVVKLHTFSFDTSASISSTPVWKGSEPLSPTSRKPPPISNTNGHHATRSSSSIKPSLEEKKMLLQQKESLEVLTEHFLIPSPLSCL